jgi:hypothetical protein
MLDRWRHRQAIKGRDGATQAFRLLDEAEARVRVATELKEAEGEQAMLARSPYWTPIETADWVEKLVRVCGKDPSLALLVVDSWYRGRTARLLPEESEWSRYYAFKLWMLSTMDTIFWGSSKPELVAEARRRGWRN